MSKIIFPLNQGSRSGVSFPGPSFTGLLPHSSCERCGWLCSLGHGFDFELPQANCTTFLWQEELWYSQNMWKWDTSGIAQQPVIPGKEIRCEFSMGWWDPSGQASLAPSVRVSTACSPSWERSRPAKVLSIFWHPHNRAALCLDHQRKVLFSTPCSQCSSQHFASKGIASHQGWGPALSQGIFSACCPGLFEPELERDQGHRTCSYGERFSGRDPDGSFQQQQLPSHTGPWSQHCFQPCSINTEWVPCGLLWSLAT